MRSIKYCLNQQLSDICHHAIQLEQLSNIVLQFLTPELAKHCQVGSFNKGCLVLSASDATWAAQLRYSLPELRDYLRKEAGMYHLSSLKVQISQLHFSSPSKIPIPRALSQKTRDLIIHEGEQCQYKPLQEAWLHLARQDER